MQGAAGEPVAHQERPELQQDRAVVLFALGAAAAGAIWLLVRILGDREVVHAWETLTLILLLSAATGLAWVLRLYRSAEYLLMDDALRLCQFRRETRLPLAKMQSLYRWRQRWNWSGNAEKDLGVELVTLYPPVWWVKKKDLWVIVYETEDGRLEGACIRPSQKLLSFLKRWLWERKGVAD